MAYDIHSLAVRTSELWPTVTRKELARYLIIGLVGAPFLFFLLQGLGDLLTDRPLGNFNYQAYHFTRYFEMFYTTGRGWIVMLLPCVVFLVIKIVLQARHR